MVNRRALAVGLVVSGLGWAYFNGPVEGPILITFTPEHGLTAADLLSLAAFGLAVPLWLDRPQDPLPR